MIFEQSWRWYGPKDPVSLENIKQAGAHGVVTALHHIPVGETWSTAEIQDRISLISASNERTPFALHWNVVESLPVHEAIKQGRPEREQYIEHYKDSLRNLGACGIRIVCYNFMPVLDWLRTSVGHRLKDGSTALLYDQVDLAVFDLYILKREAAEKEYASDVLQKAEERNSSMTNAETETLKKSLLMALPGDEKGFTLEKLAAGLAAYNGISAEDLRRNLVYFLKEVIPVAEENDIKMAIHPDDPPWSVFGLPRVVSNASDLNSIFKEVPQNANGLTFCSGSLGASDENELPKLIEKYYERIHFVHLRSVQRRGAGYFYEADHLKGSAGMYKLVKTFHQCQQKHGQKALPMRPDHGHAMMGDQEKTFYPGYSLVGRMRGLAELRGLELGIMNSI